MDPCASTMPPLRHWQDNPGAPTVHAQDRHAGPPSPSASCPWPRLPGGEDAVQVEEDLFGATKPTLFETGRLDDPPMGQRRRRATNSPRQTEKLEREAAEQRDLREPSQAEEAHLHSTILELERSLADTRQQLRGREQELRGSREKHRRMRTHMEMIAACCEEGNTARRMIITLLALPSVAEEA